MINFTTTIEPADVIWEGQMPQAGDANEPKVMEFRVNRLVMTDDVPHLTQLTPELSGKFLLAIADVQGPITNYTYAGPDLAPHLDAIKYALSSGHVYRVETDSTEAHWPHNPDPRGRIEQRIVRAIAEQTPAGA